MRRIMIRRKGRKRMRRAEDKEEEEEEDMSVGRPTCKGASPTPGGACPNSAKVTSPYLRGHPAVNGVIPACKGTSLTPGGAPTNCKEDIPQLMGTSRM